MIIGVDASRLTRAQRTGTERYSLEIVRHLLLQPAARRHQWRLYTPTPFDVAHDLSLPVTACANVDVAVLPARRLWTHRALARAVVTQPPDVLFVPAHVIPYVQPRRRLPPSVVTLHDLGYHFFPQQHTWRQRLYLEWSTRWSARAATRVIAVSRATADDLVKIYAVAPDKIDVVHEAAPRGGLPGSPQGISRQQSASKGFREVRPYALFLGTLQPRKNLHRILDAFARIHAQVDWDLVLAGAPGWHSDGILRHAAQLDLGDRLRFTGYVPDDVATALMHGARFFCFPSLYEGFGLPVLEAQAQGVPVMTSTNSSLPEIAGDAALLVDPTDVDAIAQAMLRLATDEALRTRLIAAGHENVQRFSWEKAAQETLVVLERAAQEGTR
ncbi:MAG: glycosyltransferase family 4 protein [Caldilineaceae bacterium]|nr:glycosyltransferase family 4 protein [Caldilineaceae bacterium]